MKKYWNLYPQIYAFENLLLAWQKARRGKRYSATAAAFECNLDVELTTLHDELCFEFHALLLRGGSWNNNNENNLRADYRNRNNPNNRNNNRGFRLARPYFARLRYHTFTDVRGC
jgi:hypothetical protein